MRSDTAVGYSRAVVLFAQGDHQEALAALQLLALSFAEGQPAGGLDQLRQVELAVAQSVLPSSPELFAPMILLHQEALLERLEKGTSYAPHARAMMLALSELYSTHAEIPEQRRIASDLFASVAGYFRQTSAALAGIDLYSKALELDRNNEAALIGIAVAHEQQGRYEKALPFLRRLAEAHPEYHEGQLRLAINLARFNQRAHGLSILRQLEESPAPDWAKRLGYHERARILLQLGNMNEAAATLRRGLTRFQRDSEMMIMLAYVEERQGGDQRPWDLELALNLTTSGSGDSPRYRYSEDPKEALARARRRFRAYAERHLGALAEAFAAMLGEATD